MLDFGENADESAAGIIGFINQSLDKFGLSLSQVTAYNADNTNVNFGISVTNLKKMICCKGTPMPILCSTQ